MKTGKSGKKKAKGKKSTKSRDSSGCSQVEDVQVHTALPPQVEGQLRCFCRLSVSQIVWGILNPPDVTHVRVKWWGESGDGAIFRPFDVKQPGKAVAKTTARYPIRSGPKQFAAYLTDMGSLLIEVLSGPSRIPVGRTDVPQISLLSPTKPVNGFFPVFSPSEEKIAEIHLSVLLESLMDSYDSMGSIPTTDVSMDTYSSSQDLRSTLPKQLQPVPYSQPARDSTEDVFASPATNKTESRKGNDSGSSALPRFGGLELRDEGHQLRCQDNDGAAQHRGSDAAAQHRGNDGAAVFITTSGDVIRANPSGTSFGQSSTNFTQTERRGLSLDMRAPVTGDLLSNLLDRGTKLREAMIISSMDGETNESSLPYRPTAALAPLDLPLTTTTSSSNRRSHAGVLFKEVTQPSKWGSPSTFTLSAESDISDYEGRAVDLVVGPTLTNGEYQNLRAADGSPQSSLSDDPDIASDVGDPLHDDTIIQELFYKHGASDQSSVSGLSGDEAVLKTKSNSSLSVDDPGNIRPPSRRSSFSSAAELATLEKQTTKTTPTKRRIRSKTKKTKGLKRRRRSRSRASSVNEQSDSDQLSTPRSETSRVSFDMIPSDLDEPVLDKPPKSGVDGLSVERLTLLGRVHVARVTIDSLKLTTAGLDTSFSSRKGKTKGKPPKPSPKAKKPCTYFIEYQFPVVATSRDKHSPNAMATEVTRVASKTVRDSKVLFNHRSVFPIYFDGSAVEKWWKSALMFRVFSRTPGQKIPSEVGSCGIPLKSILRSDGLFVSRELEVRDGTKPTTKKADRSLYVNHLGNLMVGVELASDSKDFSTVMAKTQLAEMNGNVKIVPISPTKPSLAPGPTSPMGLEAIRKYKKKKEIEMQTTTQSCMSTQTEPRSTNLQDLLTKGPLVLAERGGNSLGKHTDTTAPQVTSFEAATLHTLLLIPEGRNISCQGRQPICGSQPHKLHKPSTQAVSGVQARNLITRNTYLVCRMFWCDDFLTSNICWGTDEPQFGFSQVAPVLLSPSLMERMRNNFMIVEVWDKKTSAENDKLVGIVKLGLHQFYMSFREPKIATALLRSQFPVISVDNYLPVVDPFSGGQFGQIKVLLAMGSLDQVAYLQRLKGEPGSAVAVPERPLHYMERQDLADKSLLEKGRTLGTEAAVEHQFEVVVEGIRRLKTFEEMIWGEADCFVQYYFPTQSTQTLGVCSMASYRTATTLCLPDPTFHDVTRHKLVLSPGSPVQRELLTACSSSGGGLGGLPFEVWCRHYHPNVRDHVVAKGTLPLAKLCAMVTMQKKGEQAVQTFSLQLTTVLPESSDLDPESHVKVKYSGLMEVTISYRTQLRQSEGSMITAGQSQSGAQVCITLGVIRASGLKAAAEHLSHLDSGMQYPAEVGVNAYMKVKFSFLTKDDERITRTVARNFAPEFSHHMDFPCPLLWTEANSDALSLAEILETGEVTLEMWHQVPGLSSGLDVQYLDTGREDVTGRRLVSKTSDVLLGTTTVQLRSLISHRTGITGWYPVNLPPSEWTTKDPSQSGEQASSSHSPDRVVGGVEVSIKFAHHDDRERVVDAARRVGWSPIEVDVEEEEWESEEESIGRAYQVTVTVDETHFPLNNAMIIGQTKLDHSARCYVRYKFYDRAAVVSKVHGIEHTEFGYLTSQLKHKHQLQLPASSPFKWYLREDRLEVQIWVSYGVCSAEDRPRHRDKLIGSAFISMETLADPRRKQHRISGLYPLYKPGTACLGGAFLRAHITLKPLLATEDQILQFEEADSGDLQEEIVADEDYDPNDSFHHLMAKRQRQQQQHSLEEVVECNATPCFSCHVSVERAMHLPIITEKNGSESHKPNTYVSFQTSELSRPFYTSVLVNTDCPIWDFDRELQLTTELLYQETKNLVFKVWHKPDCSSREPDKSSDRVLGFVSVDLIPLTSGLQQICGWYNIMDFNGQCRGQIKVSITPMEALHQYRDGPSSPSQHPKTIPPSYTSSGLYAPFPGHMTWISERIGPSARIPDVTLPHFREHYENVKHHHEMLQKHSSHSTDHVQTKAGTDRERGLSTTQPSQYWTTNTADIHTMEEPSASKSFLFSALRKQLQELDEINDKFKARLAATETTDPEYAPLSGRSYELPVSSRSGPFMLNSSAVLSSVQSRESARDNTSEQDSGNVTGTICHDFIGSGHHLTAPPEISEYSREVISERQAPVPGGGSGSQGLNTLSSDLEVSTEFLQTHVSAQIQELLQAARQLQNNSSNLQNAVETENRSDMEDEGDNQNYYHQYREMLDGENEEEEEEDSDTEEEEDIIVPRALNDISAGGFHFDNTEGGGEGEVRSAGIIAFPSPIPELSSVRDDMDSWLADEDNPGLEHRDTGAQSAQHDELVLSDIAKRRLDYNMDMEEDMTETKGHSEAPRSVIEQEYENKSILSESEPEGEVHKLLPDLELKSIISAGGHNHLDIGEHCTGPVIENEDVNVEQALTIQDVDRPRSGLASGRSGSSTESQQQSSGCRPVSGDRSSHSRSKGSSGSSKSSSVKSSPRLEPGEDMEGNGHQPNLEHLNGCQSDRSSVSSKSSRLANERPAMPSFFPSDLQMEQSLKALQLITKPEHDSEMRRKARTTQDGVPLLSHSANTAAASKFPSTAIKNKPLPTVDETKRIAKIFASKFA